MAWRNLMSHGPTCQQSGGVVRDVPWGAHAAFYLKFIEKNEGEFIRQGGEGEKNGLLSF